MVQGHLSSFTEANAAGKRLSEKEAIRFPIRKMPDLLLFVSACRSIAVWASFAIQSHSLHRDAGSFGTGPMYQAYRKAMIFWPEQTTPLKFKKLRCTTFFVRPEASDYSPVPTE